MVISMDTVRPVGANIMNSPQDSYLLYGVYVSYLVLLIISLNVSDDLLNDKLFEEWPDCLEMLVKRAHTVKIREKCSDYRKISLARDH